MHFPLTSKKTTEIWIDLEKRMGKRPQNVINVTVTIPTKKQRFPYYFLGAERELMNRSFQPIIYVNKMICSK